MTDKKKKYAYLLPCLLLIFNGCHCNKNRKNPDVSGVEISLTVKRFDRDFFAMDPENLAIDIPKLLEEYPDFFPFYMENILGFPSYEKQPEQAIAQLKNYMQDQYVRELYDSCEVTFGDLSKIREDLKEALMHYKYYYPEKTTPEIITYISNMTFASLTYDTTMLGIGLDMYLGSNFKYYPTKFPQYLYQSFSKEYMVPNCMRVLASMNFDLAPKENQLLSYMINKGIELYFTDLMLPETPDYLKIGYTKEDIEWCEYNEPEIWKFFVDQELLYSSNMQQNSKYVRPGPSTSGMPKEAPGNIGSWVGWQIVRAFMRRNPDVTIEELLSHYSAKEILFKSKYKPRES